MGIDLSSLNPQQLEAVTKTEGAILVVAGAGTGKTKVLTSRIAHIITSGLCLIDEILAVTFTNKAAMEMSQRALKLLKDYSINNFNDLWIGTFHSLALRILRPLYNEFNRSTNFTVIDNEDQLRIIKQIMKEWGISDNKYSPKYITDYINKINDKSNSYLLTNILKGSTKEIMIKIYNEYKLRLTALDAIDFSDILKYSIQIFNKNNNILNYYQQKFKYILVDEYQDTNASQYTWLKLLAVGHGNICCVGDDDQSIYSWRGADLSNILQFDKDFKDAKTIRLEQNYRSTQNILKAAGALISRNEKRIPKRFTTSEEKGMPIFVKALSEPIEESAYIARTIINKIAQGYKYKDIAILVRMTAQTRLLEEQLLLRGIPYTLIGGIKFYERKEIKDAIAYLKLINNKNDNISFERVINIPKRGIGLTTMKKIHEEAQIQNISLYEAAKIIDNNKLNEFLQLIDKWSNDALYISPSKLMQKILEESGYLESLKIVNSLENETRIDNIKELILALNKFNNIIEFLDYISLVFDNIDQIHYDSVTVNTIHGSKGLEYLIVFIPGFEEGIIPHQKSLSDPNELEEERRLCYVALTRARKEVFVTLSNRRIAFGNYEHTTPSRFLYNIPADCIKML